MSTTEPTTRQRPGGVVLRITPLALMARDTEAGATFTSEVARAFVA